MRRATICCGDALAVLRTLPTASFQCCVTSPPYWGLRDYGTGAWAGGDPECRHVGRSKPRNATTGAGEGHGRFSAERGTQASKDIAEPVMGGVCRCGAVRVDDQIGLEATPQAYVARLVEVFEEVRRVLRDDGTLWLNLGDCYANDTKWGGRSGGKHAQGLHGASGIGRGRRETGLKAKDLVGIPWRVAFALQDAGWYLRSDCIWDKANGMPESVQDRPTKAHEYVFLLAKAERYFYDAEAVREPDCWVDNQWRGVLDQREPSGGLLPPHRGLRRVEGWNGAGRNLRTVWRMKTQPFPEAHFATFPPELAERCIRAGSGEGDAILDPFGGAGTTAMVALRLNRSATSIELNPAYCAMQERRIHQDAPLLNDVHLET